MASIVKQGDGKWRAQIKTAGVRASKTFRTKREADLWAHQSQNKIRSDAANAQALREKIGAAEGVIDAQTILNGKVPAYNAPGIYVLFHGQEAVYVGQSRNVLKRITGHAENGRQFDSFFAIPCLECDLDKMEQHYINVLRPVGNKTI